MFKRVIYIVILVFTTTVFAQSYTKYTVAKGETIAQIAQKFKVTPYDIYKLNPDAKNGVQPNSVLLIPKSTQLATVPTPKPVTVKPKVPVVSNDKIHIVVAGDTKYSISKKYKISVEFLEMANPILKTSDLKVGQTLKIIYYEEPPKMAIGSKMYSAHEVVVGDTKYNIAKKYGITVEELEKQNPEIKDNLPLGFQLKIAKGSSNSEVTEEVKPKAKPIDLLEYTVKSGETIYSLTHLFNLSEASLIGLNPDLKEGVKEGMVLKVPANLSFAKETKNSLKDLTKSIANQNKKQLVLFLPFNISKIQNDSVTSVSERLKKDKFLNMTLDFYSGALMAIDSAKVLGMNVDIKIFDSEETKNSTNALSIISSGNFADADAVIGPFYQVNVEKVAAALESKNIPVISPLSKDDGKSYKNLFQSMPQNDDIRKAMFDYMHSKNGNIIGVLDPKKLAVKQYIQDFQKEVKVVGLSDKGGFVADSIKKYFVKDKINYVVLASEKTGTIFTVTNAMLNSLKEYQVQLVILEPNETLDFEEIDLKRLTKLKMVYPSASKDNDTEEAQQFEMAYKKKNRIFPNQYAVRGFDLTFDTLLRLSQEKSLQDSLDNDASEQVESKFDYAKKISGGYANNGIYILYYDEDLTIKQAE
ncbi:LysM peptidoglycan-binding domain-containing protein [Flavobacterium sp. SUN052]|uniref:PBP1 and LysM peptidoglycan-binding domain-containing protein n=1 Tax=Flavobacterium sp. SUN052 TaxID=3002441 RepID=UPI00237E6108|nr:LysM peptidoglycan-binding domain-containing protein [Flavobacterium sp. SUN052]MEC4005334.1 LysM peptidoglycan-binding domain-containing protein [Flavobacterium sp. SUN052]